MIRNSRGVVFAVSALRKSRNAAVARIYGHRTPIETRPIGEDRAAERRRIDDADDF